MKKHYIGLLGCGNVAVHHMNAIEQLSNAEVKSVFSTDKVACFTFAEKYGLNACLSLEEIINDDQIDIIAICTPSGTHADLAIQAMNAGKHVMVEKPLALTVEDCEAVWETSKNTGKKCQVICQLRFSETTRIVKETIEKGLLGKIVNSGCYMKYYRDPSYYNGSNWRGTTALDGGGALMNQGIHGIDLMIYLLGMPTTVTGVSRTLYHDIEVEDCAAAIVTYKNGGIGVIEGSTCTYPGYDRVFQICGTKGSITLREDAITVWDVDAPCPVMTGTQSAVSGASDPTALNFAGHQKEYADLIRAIEENAVPMNGPEKAVEAVKLILSIYASSKKEKTVDL